MPLAAGRIAKLTPAQRLLYAGTAIIALLGMGLFAFASWSDYRDTRRRMASQGRHITRVVEEHARGIVQASGAVVRHAAEFGLNRDADDKPGFQRWLELVSLADSLPERGSLWLIDQTGRLVLHTVQYPAPDLSVTGQRYFQEHLAGRATVVGEAIPGLLRETPYMTVSQRLVGADGAFRGVIAAGIELRYFSAFYQSLEADADTTLAIFRTDGRVLVQYPPLQPSDIGRDYTHLRLFELLGQSTQGSYRGRSEADGAERLYHFAIVPSSRLVAVAGISIDAALAPWQHRMLRNGAGAALATTGLLALALFGYRALRREERDQAALAEAHGQLRLTMARLERARADADQANWARPASWPPPVTICASRCRRSACSSMCC